jgi:hypothetical protein
MRLDLIDYFYLSLYPYVAGEGRRLFDDVGKYGPLDLVSSMTFSNGTLELEYRGTADADGPPCEARRLPGRSLRPGGPWRGNGSSVCCHPPMSSADPCVHARRPAALVRGKLSHFNWRRSVTHLLPDDGRAVRVPSVG